VFCKN